MVTYYIGLHDCLLTQRIPNYRNFDPLVLKCSSAKRNSVIYLWNNVCQLQHTHTLDYKRLLLSIWHTLAFTSPFTSVFLYVGGCFACIYLCVCVYTMCVSHKHTRRNKHIKPFWLHDKKNTFVIKFFPALVHLLKTTNTLNGDFSPYRKLHFQMVLQYHHIFSFNEVWESVDGYSYKSIIPKIYFIGMM